MLDSFNKLLLAAVNLLALAYMLHLAFPKAYHWLVARFDEIVDALLAAWAWLWVAGHDPGWEAHWEGMWGPE